MSFFTGELSKLSWMLNLCGPCSFQNDLRTTSERDPSWACSDSIWPDTDVWNCGTQALAVFWLSLVTCRLFNYFQHTQTDRCSRFRSSNGLKPPACFCAWASDGKTTSGPKRSFTDASSVEPMRPSDRKFIELSRSCKDHSYLI